MGLLVGEDGARDEIRGGVCLEQLRREGGDGEVVVGSGGVGKNGVGNGGEGWRDGRGVKGGGVGSQRTEMLCYDGCRVDGSNWGARFPVASLGYVVPMERETVML